MQKMNQKKFIRGIPKTDSDFNQKALIAVETDGIELHQNRRWRGVTPSMNPQASFIIVKTRVE
jgi:hypothetical protein